MLTLVKVGVAVGDGKGALAMAQYVLEAADSPEAFARGGAGGSSPRPHAMWLGSQRALDRLGLTRGERVEGEALALAFQGRHAVTGVQVRRPGSVAAVDREGRPRLDEHGEPYREAQVNSFRLAFSVPKSVSVLWSQADAALRKRIELAVMDGANAAVEHVVGTRLVVSGKEFGRGFAASMVLHVVGRTARGEAVPDPQLHVHIDLVGVLDANGQLRTPNSWALFRDSAMREAAAVGRALLAQDLEGMRFGIEALTGRGGRYFEVVGVPQGLCEGLSGRSRDVAAWVAQRTADVGAVSGRETAAAALLTRTAKHAGLSAWEIQHSWDSEAAEFSFGQARIDGLQAAPAAVRDVAALVTLARETILRRVWEEGPAISVGALRSIAFELAPIGLSLEQAGLVVLDLQERGELIALQGGRVTSREIRERELYVKRIALEAAGRRSPGLSASAVASGTAIAERSLNGHTLDPEQKDAIELLTRGAGWACLTGRAGTGKGPVLEAVAAAHSYEGWRVIACAVDGATAVRLGAQIKSSALTLEQLFVRLRGGWLEVDDRTLIVIDEASKVGLRHWTGLARLCELTHARMLAVGDVGQIGAIESPGMLDVMLDQGKALPFSRLDTVRRHRHPNGHRDPKDRRPHPWLGRYQRALYRGKAGEAIAILRGEDAITMHATREDAMTGLVEKWAQRRREHDLEARDTVLIVHGSNEEIDQVNELAQAVRIDAGELPGDGVLAVDRAYRIYQGDVVMLREAAYQPRREPRGPVPARVENGTMGVVERVDADSGRVWVAFEQPQGGTRSVMVDLPKLRAQHQRAQHTRPADKREAVPALRLAYAGHPFPMLGATFNYVGSLWGRLQCREDVYSGDTRAKFWLDVHTDRQSTGREGTDDDRYRRIAKQLEHAKHRLASITHANAPDEPILIGITDPQRVPQQISEPQHADHATHDQQTPSADHAVHDYEVRAPDILDRYRDLLGPPRLDSIARHADTFAEQMPDLDHDQLHAAITQGQQALAHLDKPAARHALRIEDQQPILAMRIERAKARASELADDGRHRAGEALQRATAQSERALEELIEQELKLYTEGRHPNQWLQQHGQELARGIAAQRQLALEHEIQTPTPQPQTHQQPHIDRPDPTIEPLDTQPGLDPPSDEPGIEI